MSRSPRTSFVPLNSVSDVMARSAMRWRAVDKLSDVRLATFWTLPGAVPGATSVLSVNVPDWPLARVKPPVQLQVMSTWLLAAPQPLGVRVTVGATLKPELVPLIGLEGVKGSSRSSPTGRQSVTIGLTRSPADVSGTATPTCHETVAPGTVTSAVVMILLNSTETGTMVWVVQRLALSVPSPLMSMQFTIDAPLTMG